MAQVIEKDILTIEIGLIAHQVNMDGVMGAGLALQIKNKWPSVYWAYQEYFGTFHLGDVQFVQIFPSIVVANLFCQRDVGWQRRYTNYQAHKMVWPKVAEYAMISELEVYAPWKIGCGLGGGNWEVLHPIIEKLCPDVIWCRYEPIH